MTIDGIIQELRFIPDRIYRDNRKEGWSYYAAGKIAERNVFLKIISKEKFRVRCELHYKREVYAEKIFDQAEKKQGIIIPRLKILNSGENNKYLARSVSFF